LHFVCLPVSSSVPPLEFRDLQERHRQLELALELELELALELAQLIRRVILLRMAQELHRQLAQELHRQ
tara:strand:+ start:134 stop:340 length:207 start_codon:yes stop_codon:yes gene_type:complete